VGVDVTNNSAHEFIEVHFPVAILIEVAEDLDELESGQVLAEITERRRGKEEEEEVRSRPKYVGKLGQSEVAIAVGIVLREERFEDCLGGSSVETGGRGGGKAP
jgi:hypothetical protein